MMKNLLFSVFITFGGLLYAEDSAGDKLALNKAIALRYCPSGHYLMGGANHDQVGLGDHTEVDVKIVKPFWIGETEVTQGSWEAVMHTCPWKGQKYVMERCDCPASYVSWDDAVLFCNVLTKDMHEKGLYPRYVIRLPTEAEWEYACRSSSSMKYCYGNDDKTLSEYAVIETDSYDPPSPSPVGQKKANLWGIYDMHGNVNEWCLDGFIDHLPGGESPLVTSGIKCVVRGGGFAQPAPYSSCSCRIYRDRSTSTNSIGFRIVMAESTCE